MGGFDEKLLAIIILVACILFLVTVLVAILVSSEVVLSIHFHVNGC